MARRQHGFAITFDSAESLSLALAQHDQIFANLNGHLTAPTPRFGYVVKQIPQSVSVLTSGLVPISLDIVSGTVADKVGQVPIHVQWSSHDQEYSPHRTAVNFFKEPVRQFELWGSAWSQPHVPKPKVIQCSACWKFYSTSPCHRKTLCSTCGLPAHLGECVRDTRCLNCSGPHAANSTSCPVQPVPRKGKLVYPPETKVNSIKTKNAQLLQAARRTARAARAGNSTAAPETAATVPTADTTDAETASPAVDVGAPPTAPVSSVATVRRTPSPIDAGPCRTCKRLAAATTNSLSTSDNSDDGAATPAPSQSATQSARSNVA